MFPRVSSDEPLDSCVAMKHMVCTCHNAITHDHHVTSYNTPHNYIIYINI